MAIEQPLDVIRAHAGPRIADDDSRRVSPRAEHDHGRAFAVVQRVVEQHVEHLTDGLFARARENRPIRAGLELAPRGGETPCPFAGHVLGGEGGDVDPFGGLVATAGERLEVLDDVLQAVGLGERSLGLGALVLALGDRAQLFQSHSQAGERPAQLMGGVGAELALAPQELSDSPVGGVERVADAVDLCESTGWRRPAAWRTIAKPSPEPDQRGCEG